jgi:peptide deformylase
MSLLPIIAHPDPFLRRQSTAVDPTDPAVAELAQSMLDTMYAAPGIGLAAVQVGELKRLFVIDLQREDESGHVVRRPHVLLNPEILETSDELSTYNEGCLSVPEMYADVIRPAQVRVRYQEPGGVARELTADGLLATCIQHELDHLNGVMFFDHLSRLKRDMLVRKYLKQLREKAAA